MNNLLKALSFSLLFASCTSSDNELAGVKSNVKKDTVKAEEPIQEKFEYVADKFADLRVLRYEVKDFDKLPLQTKTLLYYLHEAALCGRDIIYDQNYKYNLTIRRTIEAIFRFYKNEKQSEEYDKFVVYAKRFWFSNGMHHHYSSDKFIPECSKEYFAELIGMVDEKALPLMPGQTKETFTKFITEQIYDPQIAPKKVSLDSKKDLITS